LEVAVSITAGIGLVPLVLGGQEPGREILYPVATVILGGNKGAEASHAVSR
jgi:Cu/Ag efflux pump CusA